MTVEYLVVLERATDEQGRPSNWTAYAPDLPGCIATGDTPEETLATFRQAVVAHLDLMREVDEPIPAPSARAATARVA